MNITLISPANGETVDTIAPQIREYLNIKEPDEVARYYNSGKMTATCAQTVVLSWESDGSESYDVFVSGFTPIHTSSCSVSPQLLIPGTTYAWYVLSSKGNSSEIRTFTALPGAPRLISAPNLLNTRDIGGYDTAGGRKVRYGLLYRTAKMNGTTVPFLTDEGKRIMYDDLVIRTEIDLRVQDRDDGGQKESVWGDKVLYVKETFTTTAYIFPQFSQETPRQRTHDSRVLQAFPRIFEVLSDANNYPQIIHCGAGADRTGTLCFLINGLLGVSYDDLVHDFELTSFFGTGPRLRSGIEPDGFAKSGTFYGVFQDDEWNYVGFDKMLRMLMKYYGTANGTISSAIENYLVSYCKVKKDHIEKLREIMLE